MSRSKIKQQVCYMWTVITSSHSSVEVKSMNAATENVLLISLSSKQKQSNDSTIF